MKFRKRLAAMLLAGVTAVGATISAGAEDILSHDYGGFLSDYREPSDGSLNGFVYPDTYSFRYPGLKQDEILETIENPGVIENFGNPETETSILIPAGRLENYPIGTIFTIKADNDLSDPLYARDPGRTDYYQNISSTSYQNITTSHFVLTEEMKKSGILLTGCADEGVEELPIEDKPITVSCVEFTAAVALEYQNVSSEFFYSEKELITIDWAPNAQASGLLLNPYAYISSEAFQDIPVGTEFGFRFNTTQHLSAGENNFTLNAICGSSTLSIINGVRIYQGYPSITDGSDWDETTEFNSRYSSGSGSLTVTEDIKKDGILLAVSENNISGDEAGSYEEGFFIEDLYFYLPDENSDIFSSRAPAPVEKPDFPGFATPDGVTAIQNAPVGTPVTQKTAVSDGKYGERFVQKVAASDVAGKTKATFTLSNGTVTKTVSTTHYNTSLTVDGETIPADEGCVFLVYTLTGIPEDVTVTVSGVVLE